MSGEKLYTLFEDSDLSALPSTDPAGGKPWKKALGAGFVITIGAAGDVQPLDADLTAIAALTTTTFGRSLLTQADAAATRSTIGAVNKAGDTMTGTLTTPTLALSGAAGQVQLLGTANSALAILVGNVSFAMYSTGAYYMPNTGNITWSTTTNWNGTADASIIRSSASLLDVRANNGLRIRNYANNADSQLTAGNLVITDTSAAESTFGTQAKWKPGYGFYFTSDVGLRFLSGTSLVSTEDATIIRNSATLLDVRANGGLRIRNFANNADAPLVAGDGTFSSLAVKNFSITNLGYNVTFSGITGGTNRDYVFANASSTVSIPGSLSVGTGTFTGNLSISPTAGNLYLGNGTVQYFSWTNQASASFVSNGTGLVGLHGGALNMNLGPNSLGFGSSIGYNVTDILAIRSSAGVLDIRGDGGVRIRNYANTGDGNISVANVTLSGGLNLAPITKATLLASTPNAATGGRWRVTDSTPANREAYPDGTNWRWASDDTVVV